jgi:hypothetical protein
MVMTSFVLLLFLKERNLGRANWVLPRVLTFTTTQRIGVFASDGIEQACDNLFCKTVVLEAQFLIFDPFLDALVR